jgi:hypothetical protein
MSKEDLELEELEKQFLEDLNSKPKPKKTTVIDVNKFNQEFDKDFEELNKREGKINNSFEKNNYDNKFLDKLEKHLKDTPPKHIEFYNKLKYRGNNVIGINFKAEKKGQYSRKKIEEIANELSHYLQEEGVRGIMSNALLYPSDWKSGLFTEIGEDVILADLKKYLEFYEEPSHYAQFQLYLILKPKAEGGNDKFNDCLYNCLHSYLYNRLPWKKPEELKKYLKLKRNDKIPISCIAIIENKLKTYQINIRGDYIYSSTVKSNKVINLILSNEHYTIDRSVDNCKIKNVSYTRKTILLVDRKTKECYDGIEKKIKNFSIDIKSKYLLVFRENNKIPIEEEYNNYIEAADLLYEESNGVIDLRKTGTIKDTALNLFDKFSKFVLNPAKLEQDESLWISECNSGALMYAEKGYNGQAYKYDVKSMYPFLLSSPLKFPIERGEFNILCQDEFNKMEYYQLGIYRVKIEKSEDENINKLFRFNKYNKYTHTSLEHAKSLNFKMTLIQDEKANFLYYSPEKRIGCNEVFGEYVSYMYDLKEKESKLKERKKEIKKAKNILNCLWGGLSQIDKSYLVYKNKILNIDDDCDIYSIKPNEKNENHLEIITTKQSKFYKTGFARISVFLISQGRYMMSKILYPHRENIKQLHTDGFVSDKLLDIKTGEKMGDLVFEGKCDNCIIHHVNSVEGEFKN